MTDVALIDHQSRCQRAWAAFTHEPDGIVYYRVDVLALPLANQEPPPMMTFELRPIPVEGIALADWFMHGAASYVALQACELVSAQLTEITEAEFIALTDAHRPAEIAPEMLEPGPNRAQRRAQARPKRGRH